MPLVDPDPDTKVFVVGGGDWITVDYLRECGVTVNHVDPDGEFMRDAKMDSFFARWYDDAYEYGRLSTTVTGDYRYLQKMNETYDLVLLDIFDATNDDLFTLYSTEFYRSVRTHSSENGVTVTQGYSPDVYPEHHRTFVDTVGVTGSTQKFSYWVCEDFDDGDKIERAEQFCMLVPDDHPRLTGDGATRCVHAREEHYGAVEWHATSHYRGVRENSIFHPNYGILVGT